MNRFPGVLRFFAPIRRQCGLLLLALTITLFAAAIPSHRATAEPSGGSDLRKHAMAFGPDIYSTTLDNGLRVLILPDHRLPLAHVGISVKTGAFSETPDTNGLAHLYEHMFFTANETISSASAFENRERELGIVSNAYTSEEAVVYYFSLPSDNLKAGVEFMSSAMLRPLFKEEELTKERKVVLDEYNTRTSRPPRQLSRAVSQALFHKYPWRRNTLGSKEVIKQASQEDMRMFRRNYYRPGNSCVIVVGDVRPEPAVSAVASQFDGWEAGEEARKDRPAHPPLSSSKTVVVEADARYAMLQTSQFGPAVQDHPDATYAADVWGTILSMSSSSFQKNLVDQGPFRNASLSYYTQQDGPTISFRGTFAPGQRTEALKAYHRELANMTKPGYFTKDQLEAARASLIVRRKTEVENGRDYLQSLGFWWSVTGLDYYTDYLDRLRNVTLEEVRSFCRTYVSDQPRVYGFLMPSEQTSEEDLSESALSKTIQTMREASYSFTPSGGEGTEEGVPSGLTNVSYERPESSDTTFFRLDNGIPVIYRPETENEVVSLQVFFDGGTMNYRDRPAGVEQFLLKAMLRGSKAYPLNTLQSVTDRQGIDISSSANYDYSRLHAGGLTEDLPLMLDILEDVMKRPRLSEEQVEWVRKQMVSSVKKRQANPRRQVWHVANRVLFDGHPYRKRPGGTLTSLKKIDREMLAAYREELVGSGRMLVSVVGRLPTNALKKELNETLGTLPETSYERPETPEFKPGSNRLTIDSREGVSTAFVAAKYPLPSMTDSDYPALKLGLDVLSTRIFEETRTRRGLTYGAYAGMPYYRRNWGYLFVTTPRPNLAMGLIFREIREMKRQPVEPAELKRNANVFYTRQMLERQTATSRADLLGRHELVGSGWERFGDVLERVRSLSPKEVQQALKSHLGPYYFGVIQGPGVKEKVDQELFLNPSKAIKSLPSDD